MIRLGLLGHPLSHSLSPKLHTAALKACDLQGDYSLYPVNPGDIKLLRTYLDKIRIGDLTGLNVTIPHKQNVIQFLDELTPGARAIGAVNTIYLKNHRLIGDNTDAPGFITDLNCFLHESDTQIENEIKEKSALIIGAGGSARAVAYALANAGWTITIAARRIEQAREFAHNDLRVIQYDFDHIAQLVSTIFLIVNATPVGMSPNTDNSLWIDGLAFPKGAVLYDLIYNPRETMLAKQAHAAGLRARTGIGMLIEQAALSFQTWTGQNISRHVMFNAINSKDERSC
jgi:shikimate dehydrogenase